MEITTLPNDINTIGSDKIQLYNYKNLNDIIKSKINLSKNTISFLRAGTKEVMGKGKAEKIDNQSFLIMKSGNCLMTEKVSSPNNFYQSILLFFDDELAMDLLEKYDLATITQPEEKSFFVFKYDDFLLHFVQSLATIIKLPKEAQNALIKVKFEEMMLYLSAQYGTSFLNSIVQKADDRTSKLTNIVDNNKFNKLTLEELAFLCNMSLSTFKREFFKVYQNTPIKWFNEQRLNHIATLLRTHKKRPIDLYEDAGYENFSNFVQAFKKKFGLTPKQYQNLD
ncbi:MAG: AraC family transcriptional regulator [Bacteroidota bacterium]